LEDRERQDNIERYLKEDANWI